MKQFQAHYVPVSNPNRRNEFHDKIEGLRQQYTTNRKRMAELNTMAWQDIYLIRGITSRLEQIEYYALVAEVNISYQYQYEKDYYDFLRKYRNA
jgi:hypothetical protein